MVNLNFRDLIKGTVGDEFDNLVARLNKMWGVEHVDDGTHGDITADSLDLQGAAVGEFVDLQPHASVRFTASGTTVWTVTDAKVNYLKYTRTGQLVTLFFSVIDTDTTTATGDTLIILLPELHVIPFGPGQPVAGSQVWTGGVLQWSDGQAATDGMGFCWAQSIAASPNPTSRICLTKIGPADGAQNQWPVSNNLSISGSVMFPVNPNNVSTPFSF